MKWKKILNRKDMREKAKYLVIQKGYTIQEDIWKELENVENAMDLVEEFEKQIREKKIRRVHMRKEKRKEKELNLKENIFKRTELLEKYTVRILFGQDNRKFENKYLKKLERSWAR